MSSENIICFAKDWDEDPTSCNHVMKALSADNRVLWLNSICARRPNFGSGRDLRKIGRKLIAFLRGPTEVARNLWVYTPLVLPFPYTDAATAVNRWILRATVRLLRLRLRMRDFQLWTFLPTTAAYVGVMGESVSVYYCTDEWSGFEHLGGEPVAAMEQALCEKVDVVLTTSVPLRERKAAFNAETHLASHGVDHAHFATALDASTPVASELQYLPRPVIGFFGLIESWIDIALLARLAGRRPDWSIVLIGRAVADVTPLQAYPNVYLLGRRPYRELPSYAKGFDVAVCPFVVNELTRCINPIKLREYLSAGLPVVATGIPEAASFSASCRLVDGPAAFVAACEDALRDDNPDERRRRSDAMRHETWARKADECLQIALRVRAAKLRPADGVPAPAVRVSA